jgi:ankyrin repeat protein
MKEHISSLNSQFEKSKKLNERDNKLRSPIFYALFFNNYDMVSFLLNQGADTIFSDEY